MKVTNTSKIKSSFINLLYNYANVSFVIINGLILVPLYFSYFSVGTYGSYLSSRHIIGMLGLLEGGMSFVLTQRLSNCYVKNKMDEFSRILGSGLFLSLSIFCSLVCIGFILAPFISNWVKAEPNEYKNIQYAFLFSAIGAGLNIVFHNISAIFQALLKVHICGFSNIISIIFGISATLLGLKFGLGVIAIPLGILIRGAIGIIILIVFLMRFLRQENIPSIQVNKSTTQDLLKSILPMFGGGVAKSLVTNSQLIIITNFINPTASAVFFITGKIYQVCDSFLAPVGSSIFSSISQITGEENKSKLKNNIIKIFFYFNIFSILILSLSYLLNTSFVYLLMGPDKYGGDLLSFLLCFSMLLSTRYNFLTVNLFALGVFGKTIIYDFYSGILRLFLIFFLIRYIGFIALPIAEIIATILISGFFLNKLIIHELVLNNKESQDFAFSGFKFILLIVLFDMFWISMFPQPYNIQTFLINFLLICIISFSIIIIFSSDIRQIFFSLISKFIKKSNA